MRRAVVSLVLVLAVAIAHADRKDRDTARILSGAAAGVSGAVAMAGFLTTPSGEAFNLPVLYTGVGLLFVTPSLGEFYAGQYVTLGMGIRAAATAFAVYTLQTQTRAVRCDETGASTELDCEIFTENAYPFLGIAAIGFIGGVWYDVLDAGDAADRYNRRHGLVGAPALLPGGAPGFAVSGYF